MPLPPEIVDLIIDWLVGCTLTLRMCSLVAKSWVNRSRMHLFRTVKLSGPRRWKKAMPIGNASPAVYVRALRLVQVDPESGWINADGLDPFLPHLRDFKNVEDLMLDGWVPSRLSEGELKEYFGSFCGKLRLLFLKGEVTLDSLLGFLGIFTNLENLSIFGRIREEETTRVPTVSPKLSGRLMIECNGRTRTLLKTLCKLPLRFQNISLAYCYWGCQELIDACAETLVDFQAMSWDFHEGAYDYSFEKCPKLREVRLIKSSVGGPEADFIGIVSSITSRHIQRIIIELLRPVTDAQLRSAAESKTWQKFDDAITRLTEQTLDNGRKLQLELDVYGDDLSTGLFDPIFPRFLQSGCLKVMVVRASCMAKNVL